MVVFLVVIGDLRDIFLLDRNYRHYIYPVHGNYIYLIDEIIGNYSDPI